MPTDRDAILKLEVPLVARMGRRRINVADLLSLAPGKLLEMPLSASSELEILAGNKPIARGRAVRIGGNYGVRITSIQGGSAEGTPRDSADEEPPGD